MCQERYCPETPVELHGFQLTWKPSERTSCVSEGLTAYKTPAIHYSYIYTVLEEMPKNVKLKDITNKVKSSYSDNSHNRW
jgi:hypothetical protein